MIKYIIAGLLVTSIAHAENWTMVTDSNSGTRLVADVDSVKFDKYNKGNSQGHRAMVTMQYVTGEYTEPFLVIIDIDECIQKKSGVLVSKRGDSQQIYFWTNEGNKMYDAQGQWLCGFTIGSIEALKNKKSNTPKEYNF